MLNPIFQDCLETGQDYIVHDEHGNCDEFHMGTFVRMYRMGIPCVCWLTHNGQKDVYWNPWQIFDLIRQNNIHPQWMRKADHDELYKNDISAGMAVRGAEQSGYPRRDEHGQHRRRRRTGG
jgi:hypothetical protein